MYKINLDQTNNLLTFIIEISSNPINNDGTPSGVVNKVFSCELINNSNYTNKLLVCFAVGQPDYLMCSLTFNPEDNLSFLYYSDNLMETDVVNSMNSGLSFDNKNCLIFFVDRVYSLNCLLYNNSNSKFNNAMKVIPSAQVNDVGIE